MQRIAEIILEKGCGLLNPVETFESERFKKLLKLFSDYNPKGDEKIALNLGHLVMGELLNTFSEPEAIKVANNLSSKTERNPNNYAMIQFVGESLINAAQKCLTNEIIELAKKWRQVEANEQIKIACQLYFIFRSESQESKGVLSMKTLQMSIENKAKEIHGERAILPLLYGKWNKNNVANCQGKTQMLIAFARLAKARVMCADPLSSCHDMVTHARYNLRDLIVTDLKSRHLEDGDDELGESIQAYSLEEQLGLYKNDNFHSSVALELKDKRWILIDPHGLAWGVFPETYDLQNVFMILEKYQLALPGLNIIDHDHGVAQRIIEQRVKDSVVFLKRSREMEKEINVKVKSIPQLIDFVTNNLDVIKTYFDLEGIEMPIDWDNPNHQQLIATNAVLNKEDIFNFSLINSEDFLKARIKNWLTLCHAITMNILGNQLSDEAEITHPVCGFGLPEYHMAIACLNSISIDYRYIADRFFINHSFDQVSLHNTGLLRNELGQAAIKALRALPFTHKSCKKFL